MEPAATTSIFAPSSWGRLARLAQKEMRETLRDRRTLGTLVLMPLLVYPLLNVAFQKLLLSGAHGGGGPSPVYRIGMETEAKAGLLRDYLALGERILETQAEAARQSRTADRDATEAPGDEELPPEIEFSVGSKLEAGLHDLQIDLVARLEVGPAGEAGSPPPIGGVLLYRRDSPASQAVLRYVEERLHAVNENGLANRLQELKVAPRRLAEFSRQMVKGNDSPAYSLATLAPLILILMTVTGAVYPAIDLTAGERERGTLETLIAAPVPRMSLLLAKYAAVLAVALLTALVNFLAMTLTIVGGGLGPMLFGPEGLSAGTVVQVFGLTILFAAFFAAVLLAITSFARSFKEAQAYLIPLTMLSLAPGFLAFTPTLKLNGALAVAPLANIVLVARDLLQGKVDPLWAAVAVVSTAFYALAALTAAARIFGADALLYGADEGWGGWLRRPREARSTARLGNAFACLAVLLPSYLLLSGWLAQFQATPLSTRLLGAGFVTSLLFGAVPLVAAYLGRVWIGSGFALRGASPFAFLGAAVLGFSLWPFAHEIFLANRWLGLVSLEKADLAPALRLIAQLPDVSLWLVLAGVAIAPAVFEEFFFRGYFFGAVSSKGNAARTIVVTALLFGAFHVFSSVLAVERMLPSTFLGLVLGWVRWRSGSVLPGMLLHACHNGLLISMAYYRDELKAWGWGMEDQSHMPAAWLGIAAGAAAVGLLFLAAAGKPRE